MYKIYNNDYSHDLCVTIIFKTIQIIHFGHKTGKLNEILAINEQSAQIFNKCFHIALPVYRVSVTLDCRYQSITCIKCYFSCEIIILFAIIMFNNSFSKL